MKFDVVAVRQFEDLIQAKFDKSGGPNACWPWTGNRDGNGYGSFTARIGKEQYSGLTHRLMYMLAYDVEPPGRESGLEMKHECDNIICGNPRHLALGSHGDNLRDMCARGRARIRVTKKEQFFAVLHDFMAGMSTAEIGKKYNLWNRTVSRYKVGGHYPKWYAEFVEQFGAPPAKATKKVRERLRQQAELSQAAA